MIRTRIGRTIAAIAFALVFIGVGYGIAMAASQPHMVTAKSYLVQALKELQMASPDKGGYRDKAMTATTNAINDVNTGIQYANAHP